MNERERDAYAPPCGRCGATVTDIDWVDATPFDGTPEFLFGAMRCSTDGCYGPDGSRRTTSGSPLWSDGSAVRARQPVTMTPMTSWTDPQTPITYQPTIPQRPRTPGWVWPVIAIAAVVGIVIGAGVTLLVSHGSGLGSTSTFTASGTLTLEDASFLDQVGTECTGSDGYDDIAAGAQVVIYDSTNKILKVGALSDGSLSTTGAGFCVFTFSVPGIKSGVGPYSVQVSHRGEISFNQSEAGNLSLSLGSGG